MTHNSRRFVAACLWACLLPATVRAAVWSEDFAAAQAKARAENKDLLLNFTGSDWCSACLLFNAQVLSQEVFLNEIQKRYVLVEIDFPERKPQKPELQKQNARLQAEYGVQAFPTILLMDAQARPYARFGYGGGDAAAFLAAQVRPAAEVKRVRDEALAEAAKLQGVPKAQKLAGVLQALEQQGVVGGFDAEIEQIIQSDADNEAGLKAPFRLDQIVAALNRGEDADEALAGLDALQKAHVLADPPRQRALFIRAQVHAVAKKDLKKAIELLEQARAVLPDSPTGRYIPQAIEELRNHLAHEAEQKADPNQEPSDKPSGT